jgi:hypothetical protein
VKLYELFGEKGYHTCIVTSFGVDFDAYENMALARLRGAGCHNNLLIADANMLGLALGGASALPRHAGRLYTVTGARARAVFHPKIILQLGRTKGRMIVSSANMTSSGLAGNLEVAGMVEGGGDDSGESSLIAAGWQFVSRFLDLHQQGTRRQVEWMLARTPWLRDVSPAENGVTLADGSVASFLATGGPQGIAEQFLQWLSGERVHRLILISPYWDNDLSALHLLQRRTGAAATAVLIDSERRLFPIHALANGSDIGLHDYVGKGDGRFVHGKIVIAQTHANDHVLYGSANCTLAALGNGNFQGSNEEACLYRALPAGAAIEALALAEALESEKLDRREVPELAAREELPLEEIAGRYPGRFECVFDTLSWWPPPNVPERCSVELSGLDGETAAIMQDRLPARDDGAVRYALTANPQPAFARIIYSDGSASARAIVVVLDALRDEVKDARSKRLDKAVAGLDGDTEVGLWLLESLNEIEAAEIALREGATRAPRRQEAPDRKNDDEAAEDRTLTYEQFIAGRRLRSDGGDLSRSSFAGSEIARVHGYLNRLLAIGEDTQKPANEADLAKAFDMGDEVADGADALEGGFSSEDPKRKEGTDAEEQRRRLEATRRRQNREELIDAIADLAEQVNDRAKGDGLRPIDILRLRAIVMVLAAAAWDGKSQTSAFQTLPPAGDKEGSWPRLLGKALAAYFGGNNPAIRMLRIDDYYEAIPDDILVCWATCMWSIHAVIATCEQHRENETLLNSVRKLRERIYRLTGLRQEELSDPRIARVFDAMNARFSTRLGLQSSESNLSHERMLADLGRQS